MTRAESSRDGIQLEHINVKVKSDRGQRERSVDVMDYDTKEFGLNAGSSDP